MPVIEENGVAIETLSRRVSEACAEELEADTERKAGEESTAETVRVKKPASPEFLREFLPGCGSLIELRDTDMNLEGRNEPTYPQIKIQ